jgi:hypothetical protein
MVVINPFTDEPRHVLVNIEQHYNVRIDNEREAVSLPYGMRWTDSA